MNKLVQKFHQVGASEISKLIAQYWNFRLFLTSASVNVVTERASSFCTVDLHPSQFLYIFVKNLKN